MVSDGPNYTELRLGRGVLGLYVDGAPELLTGVVKEWAEKAKVETVRIPGYWIHKKGENIIMGQKPDEKEKVIYFLHGGAYVHLSAHPSSPTSNIPRAFLKTCPSIKRSFAIEYRLSSLPPNPPSNPFPSALIDALAGYAYLVNSVGYSPHNIVIVGDSAGGNLAQALTRYLVEYADTVHGLPAPPGGLVLLSPWADMSGSHHGPGSSAFTRRVSDYLTGPSEPYVADAPRAFVEPPFGLEFTKQTPYLSPACKDLKEVSFKGFPRTFIVSGDGEVLVDQIRVLQKRMKDELGDSCVVYYEAKDAFHDYIVFPWAQPERTQTLKAISDWIVDL